MAHKPPKTHPVARRVLRCLLGAALCLAPLLARAEAPASGETFTLDLPPSAIYGGTDVVACGWPTTVNLEGGCTGTLVHPELVIYAAHCGDGYGSVQFGENIQGGISRSVPTEFCKIKPGGQPGNGQDFAFCKLAEPQTDVPIVPILMGCETDLLQPGAEVTIVGFGNADTGPYGIKREVTTTINQITPEGEAFIGGGGKDSCQGDSGGPVFIQLPDGQGSGSWRVFGITSYGGECGTGGYYSMMHNGMAWFEQESGVDLTPCHDADGTWNPTPACGMFPMDPSAGNGTWNDGCSGGPLGTFESSCGAPFNNEPDDTPPTVEITAPADGSMVMSDPGKGTASVTITAVADDVGWGVASVTLLVNGQEISGGQDNAAPYEWDAAFPPGVYTLQARAKDYADNEALSAEVTFGVDMEPPPPDPTTGGSSGGGTGGTDGSASAGGTDGGGATDTAGQSATSDGCGCRSGSGGGGPAALGLLVLAWLGRRRGR